MPNSEVKRRNADGSVGISHVRVGHRQVEIEGSPSRNTRAFCFWDISNVTKRNNRQIYCYYTNKERIRLPNRLFLIGYLFFTIIHLKVR